MASSDRIYVNIKYNARENVEEYVLYVNKTTIINMKDDVFYTIELYL